MTENTKEIKGLSASAQAQETPSDIVVKKTPPMPRRGRPPGAKNKDTLFKELMTGKFQDMAAKNVGRTLQVLFEKAHAGDMKAIKLVLDRVVPVTKAVDLADMEKKGLVVNISVGHLESVQVQGGGGDVIEDAEYTEIKDGSS